MERSAGSRIPFTRTLLLALVLPLLAALFIVLQSRGAYGGGTFLPTRVVPAATPTATPTATLQPTLTPTRTLTPTPMPTNTSAHSPTSTATLRPASPTPIVYKGPDAAALALVTKTQALSADYAPSDLVSLNEFGIPTYGNDKEELRLQPAMELAEMFAIAQREGLQLIVRSAYRSYAVQDYTFQFFVDEELRQAEAAGQPISREEAETRANRYSARPGYSQHQLGTTVDVTSADVLGELVPDFGQTPAGIWLRENAHKFGFVFSYPQGKEALTGYIYEPWHLRWIGRGHAEMLHALDYLNPDNSMTLDVYLEALQ